MDQIAPFFCAPPLLCVGVFFIAGRMHGGNWLNALSAVPLFILPVFTCVSSLRVQASVDPEAAVETSFSATLHNTFVSLLTTYGAYIWYGNPMYRLTSRLLRRVPASESRKVPQSCGATE